MWAAQRLDGGVRAFRLGDAVAVASPDLCRRDRLAVAGPAAAAARLVTHTLGECGATYRPLGGDELITEITRRVRELKVAARFAWMDTSTPPPPGPPSPPSPPGPPGGPGGGAVWLPATAAGEVTALLAQASPDAYALPGLPGVRAWAGIRDGHTLTAVAADAWSAPTAGLLAGVATALPARRRGLGERVCRFVTDHLIAAHGRACLMADGWNTTAIALYQRLGYHLHQAAVAETTPG
ncbi:GNAT family N-acetyltransferase [Spongiactinospora rosea]|uniref:GNAT family N-acetyltransferase n=2 Tax=Spongiactinospora rosea TaxID=2248750 RepID=A0A366LZV5_9ACTN|nr:GNAT family N-acetyltransferase [Spongiactinospora rosea]